MTLPVDKLEAVFKACRAEFPGLQDGLVHLHNAAGSELPQSAISAMTDYLRSGFSNEGKIFRRVAACTALNQAAHQATAELIGAAAHDVALFANTTTALYAITRSLGRTLRPGDRVFVSEACHEANIAPWLAFRELGVSVELVPMLEDTHLDYDWLEKNLDERVKVVSFGASSNGTGTVHDLARVVRAARRVGAWVSLDAAHFAPHHVVDVEALDVDLLFFSIYKCYGPHLGAAYVRRPLAETLVAYAPEMGVTSLARFETGTRNFEAYAGWLGTLAYLERLGHRVGELQGQAPRTRREAFTHALAAISAWEGELTRYGDAVLQRISGLVHYRQPFGDPRPRLGVFCFNVKGRSAVEVAEALERDGIEGGLGTNGAVRTMKRFAEAFGGVGMRLSVAHYNDKSDLDRALASIARLVSAHA